MSQRLPDYDAMRVREQQARVQRDGAGIAAGILARRAQRCADQGTHDDDGCRTCGA